MPGITSLSYLQTDTTTSELFWDEPALLKPHVPESAFPQTTCAAGLIKNSFLHWDIPMIDVICALAANSKEILAAPLIRAALH